MTRSTLPHRRHTQPQRQGPDTTPEGVSRAERTTCCISASLVKVWPFQTHLSFTFSHQCFKSMHLVKGHKT